MNEQIRLVLAIVINETETAGLGKIRFELVKLG